MCLVRSKQGFLSFPPHYLSFDSVFPPPFVLASSLSSYLPSLAHGKRHPFDSLSKPRSRYLHHASSYTIFTKRGWFRRLFTCFLPLVGVALGKPLCVLFGNLCLFHRRVLRRWVSFMGGMGFCSPSPPLFF